MIKIIGFFIIVASSAKIGFDLAEKYCSRTKSIKAFINVLERIRNEISFSNCEITDALKRASNVKSESVSKMVNYLSKKVEEDNVALDEAFNVYIDNNTMAFDRKDADEIRNFFSAFGSGDREDEIKNINNAVAYMKAHLQSSIEDEKRYVKLYRTGGVLTGLLIAIILA